MLHEQMPQCWYELLQQGIGLIKDCAIENDRHEKLLTQAQNLDRGYGLRLRAIMLPLPFLSLYIFPEPMLSRT